MASDRKQFERARTRWEALRDANELSLAPDIGIVAILHAGKANDRVTHEEIDSFAYEAETIAKSYQSNDQEAEIIAGINGESMERVVASAKYAGMVIIAHGSLSSVQNDDGGGIDWRDISEMSTHLKQGNSAQRMCGKFVSRLAVPFSTFAMLDPSHISAPVGHFFNPIDHPGDEALMRPIDPATVASYEAVIENYH